MQDWDSKFDRLPPQTPPATQKIVYNTYMVQIWKLYLYSVNFHWAMVAAPPNPPTEHVRIAICPSPFLFTQPPQVALSSTKPVLFDGKRGPFVKGLLPGA